jgi:hypothetical protein
MTLGSGWPGILGRCGLLWLLLLVAGCGRRHVTVSGRVLFNGAPLPGGRVTFRPENPEENSVSAELDEQGNYEAELPLGVVQVAVDNRELQPREPDGGQPEALPPGVEEALNKHKPPPRQAKRAASTPTPPRGQYVPIPDKFCNAATSGLKFTVEGAAQKHDIELKE